MRQRNGLRQNLRTAVLCRGVGDEPLRLIACSDWGRAVEVKTEDEPGSIAFPKRSVFRFDPELFERLRKAYAARSREDLERLWASARPYQ
jgi:hypothetical protein